MNKPYLLFKNRKSPYWYAQIRLSDGSLSNNKSTGKESKSEAEKVVMEWVVAGAVPKRVSRKEKSEIKTSLDTLSISNQLKTHDFSDSDINKIYEVESTQKLAPQTVKSIIHAMTVSMKWAFLHGLTEINCYDGIIKPCENSRERNILTMEETRALFAAKWKNETAKLACLIASYTGMRIEVCPCFLEKKRANFY